MPITFTNQTDEKDIVFDVISVPENEMSFNLKSIGGETIDIIYKPIWNGKYDKNKINISDFDFILLDTPYLNAESNVFEVFETSLKDERIGWIFPINYLVSNQPDELSERTTIDLYKYASHLFLINYGGIGMKTLDVTGKAEYVISDFFNENAAVLAIHKKTAARIDSFNIKDYWLSLFKIGYFKYSSIQSYFNKNKNDYLNANKPARRITINKSLFPLTDGTYSEAVFCKYLNQTENCYLRFVFLYQIIEMLMDEVRNKLFLIHLANYQSNNISQNDFREKINEYSKERKVISQVFSYSLRRHNDYDLFLNDCSEYLNNNSGQVANTLSDAVYNLRNLLTHNFRIVASKIDELDKLVISLEFLIADILLEYNFNESK